LSTVVPLHAGRLPSTAVLLSTKQFADQLFSGAVEPHKQRASGLLKGFGEMYRRRKTGGVMPFGGNA
jgi:hypothetical protein